ncbi:carbohydrate kinase family protein [candidate division KSB1 bacterium]|nr:carbohydrate kinase family protein [candidate division KSB1 bacterium]
MKILAMTVCCVDVYVESNQMCVGGNSINFAAQCLRSGWEHISVLGAVGRDAYGDKVMEYLRSSGIEISHVYQLDGPTAYNRIYVKDGEPYFKPDSWQGGIFEKFLLSESDWAFVKNFDIVAIPANNPNFMEALKRSTGHPRLVVDFMDERDIEIIKMILPFIDLGFISGNRELADQLKSFSVEINSPIVVTLGAEGSIALWKGQSYFHESIPVEKVIDTTGCGDSYQAAFCVSWYCDENLRPAMQAGAEAASQVLQRFGGI